MKKKIIAIFLAALFISQSLQSTAADVENSMNSVTVVFQENSRFTEEQKEFIIRSFMNSSDDQYQTCGLLCTLFGHDYQTETIYLCRHKVYASTPRCIREEYLERCCSSCSAEEKTLISTERIDCCF